MKSEAFELLFRSVSEASNRLIDSKAMVSQLVQDCGILSNFTKIRNQPSEKVSKEISLNLLEHLIMLYIRVCAFSFVKVWSKGIELPFQHLKTAIFIATHL